MLEKCTVYVLFPILISMFPIIKVLLKRYKFLIPLQGFVGIVDHAGILVSRQ
jgi:hypothetical protein